MTLQFSGDNETEALSKYLEEQIKPKLASIKGIYEVNIYGSNKLEWVITYEKKQLDILHIAEYELVDAIQKHFNQTSLGILKGANGKAINVILKGLSPDPSSGERGVKAEWKIPIKNLNGRIVYLTELATITKNERPITQYYRINGQNALNMTIVADKGANQIKLSSKIKTKLAEINQNLPQTYQLTVEHDASEYIVENLQKIAVQAGLAVLILLLFVGISLRQWWYIGLVSVSLLVNLALSFVFFYFLKVEIHLYSLAALTTSLGIIIDNTIVMIDHYQRHRNLKVFMGLLGATLTTIAGLVVIFFLPEENRIELGDFAMVMVITLLVSLPVALFFVPAIMERMKRNIFITKITISKGLKLKVTLSNFYLKIILFLKRFSKTAFLLAILLFGLPVFLLPDKIENESLKNNFLC